MTRVAKRTTRARAFTLLELLCILFVTICIVAIIFLPSNPRPSHRPERIQCVNNLKNIGLAYRLYATDNHERFPWEQADQRTALYYYLAARDELSSPKLFHCPADTRKATTNWTEFTRDNVSYFLNLDSAPADPHSTLRMLLAGDRNLLIDGVTFTRKRAEIPHTAHAAWTAGQHKKQGNVAIADGSVQQLSDARIREEWRNATNLSRKPTSTFLFP